VQWIELGRVVNWKQPVAVMLIGLASASVAAESDGMAGEDSTALTGNATADCSSADPGPAGVGYEIRWQTVDGGATFATGGDYLLRGTIGQPDADPDHPSGSSDFAHSGGFWTLLPAAGNADGDLLFCDHFES